MTTPPSSDPPASQANNPLHGITLQAMLVALSGHYGWAGLGERIALRCFTHEPSVASSLKFLGTTRSIREQLEGLSLYMLRKIRRNPPRT